MTPKSGLRSTAVVTACDAVVSAKPLSYERAFGRAGSRSAGTGRRVGRVDHERGRDLARAARPQRGRATGQSTPVPHTPPEFT